MSWWKAPPPAAPAAVAPIEDLDFRCALLCKHVTRAGGGAAMSKVLHDLTLRLNGASRCLSLPARWTLADVPTVVASGIADRVVVLLSGMFEPAPTPPASVAALNQAVQRMTRRPESWRLSCAPGPRCGTPRRSRRPASCVQSASCGAT
jgi:hypothetical protein